MRREVTPSNFPRDDPHGIPRNRTFVPSNCRSFRPLPFNHHRRDHPPEPPRATAMKIRPNFVIELRRDRFSSQKHDVRALIDLCDTKPDDFTVFNAANVAGKLFFRQWPDALESMACFWELRFDGAHTLTPNLVSNVTVPSDLDELCARLKTVFAKRVDGFCEGDAVYKWEQRLYHVEGEIRDLSIKRKNNKKMNLFFELSSRIEGIEVEKELIVKRINEFKSAMGCILGHLTGKKSNEEYTVEVFKLDGDFNWSTIYHFIMREFRRLDDGLPIYSFRQEILNHIYSQQVMVLIGQTGSGKSTQLVQFLTDSGVAASGSIICTQPRKIAAISLADRVREESSGYAEDNAIIFSPTYSTSAQQYDSKVIFMTDHCLLQHYMRDKTLGGVSCVIIDEAHERSLNTDLLLALLKDLLCQRVDLRLIIMSATADTNKLSEYFLNCRTFNVLGRNFPVDIRYVPSGVEGTSRSNVGSYVTDVVKMATEIHKSEKEGAILAFLTSQMEVEWACEKFEAPSAIALPFHGKLSYEDQLHVFQSYSGKRKVIFTTNLAETSLTIPGVKYVIDSGMVKESKFEPATGMNVLRVCRISKSAADQRAGRAGRTEPGRCYRLYSINDFNSMLSHQEPEIRRVHLGVAILRILALGIMDVHSFDFVDAPSSKAVDMAIRNLSQLDAVTSKNGVMTLTEEGRYLVKLGIEPRLGKLIMSCYKLRLGREGVVLAAVMANASSIFCRVGNEDDKLKSDCLKVQFCHRNGDLFTLLSVYKEWEGLSKDNRNKWCWEHSINAKSMRRCHDTVLDLENCLKNELDIIVPSYMLWSPHLDSENDKKLKKAVLSSLSENVAMHSGNNRVGYEVALSGQHVQLHPSCSLLIFAQKPSWVVFGEILSVSNQFLVCVTAFDVESLADLCPGPLFDVAKMESRKLQVRVMTGFSTTLLKRFCGKFKNNLRSLVSRIQSDYMDERIGIEIDVDNNEAILFSSSGDMEKIYDFVHEALECERKWLQNECFEKCIYHGGPGVLPPVALFGAGAEIRHLELEKRCLSVDVYHSDVKALDDKKLLMFIEKSVCGSICAVNRFAAAGQGGEETQMWGRVTFLSPDAAKRAAELNGVEFSGSSLKVISSRTAFGGDHKMFSFPAVRANVYWPRRRSKGVAFVNCKMQDVESILSKIYNLQFGGKPVHAHVNHEGTIVMKGLDKELSESEILDTLMTVTDDIYKFFLLRENAVINPPCNVCEEAIVREISPFLPKKNPHTNCYRVLVLAPRPNDSFMKASITFDGRLHLEAAQALERLAGKVLPGCLEWQKIKCEQRFHSSVSCPAYIYSVIQNHLTPLLESSSRRKGAECYLERNDNGSYRVKISANATKTVAELRRPLEQLMRGKAIEHANLSPTILQHLFSRDGIMLMVSLQKQTGTYILFDRKCYNVKIFGSPHDIAVAEQRLVQTLLTLHESKRLEIHLRGGNMPPDLMKQVVKKFGPDLHGIKEKVPEAELTLNLRRHVISLSGTKEMKQKVEELVYDIARTSDCSTETILDSDEVTCPICLCELDDGHSLDGCGHVFCRLCLIEQCESAIKSRDSFPMQCMHKGCKAPIMVSNLRSLLSNEKLEELFRASLGAFVGSSGGKYRYCPTPDCSSVYRVADCLKAVSDSSSTAGELFVCGSCYVETCTRCHLEYHQNISCEKYREFKDDPDSSLKEWCMGKEDHVKSCPVCGYTIEKVEGCNHVECRCGKHICWACLEVFYNSDDCYGHLRSVHQAII